MGELYIIISIKLYIIALFMIVYIIYNSYILYILLYKSSITVVYVQVQQIR